MRYWVCGARAALCMIVLCLAVPAVAQDCPVATGKVSFVVERGADSKTEVFAGEGAVVRSILRYRGQTTPGNHAV